MILYLPHVYIYICVLSLTILTQRGSCCLHLNTQASGISDPSIHSALDILNLAKKQITSASSISSGMPIATISYAQTLDGSIAPLERTRLDISSKCSFRLLHSLRSLHAGVLVGINTVLCDQPRLNVRDPLPLPLPLPLPPDLHHNSNLLPSSTSHFTDNNNSKNNVQDEDKTDNISPNRVQHQPRPIVIDSDLRIVDIPATELRLNRPIVCTCLSPLTEDGERNEKWEKATATLSLIEGTLISCKMDAGGRCDMVDCFRRLYSQCGIKTVLVEGGAGIIQSVLELGLAMQVVVTLRPCFLGGYRSMTGQLGKAVALTDITAASIEGDIVIHGIIKATGSDPSINNDGAARVRVKFNEPSAF